MISALRAAIEKIPTREERLGGQTFKYVKLSEVLDLLDTFRSSNADETAPRRFSRPDFKQWAIDSMDGTMEPRLGGEYYKAEEVDAWIDGLSRPAVEPRERICPQCAQTECVCAEKASCVHSWSVTGRIGHPLPDQFCDFGCGLRWKDRQSEKDPETPEQIRARIDAAALADAHRMYELEHGEPFPENGTTDHG